MSCSLRRVLTQWQAPLLEWPTSNKKPRSPRLTWDIFKGHLSLRAPHGVSQVLHWVSIVANFSVCPILLLSLPQVLITRALTCYTILHVHLHQTVSQGRHGLPGLACFFRGLVARSSTNLTPSLWLWGFWIWNDCSLQGPYSPYLVTSLPLHLLDLTSHTTFS